MNWHYGVLGFLFSLVAIAVEGQPVSCGEIVNTGQNHTIIISNISPILDGQALNLGSFIIVTYEASGSEACGGYTQWTGVNTAITAYGDDASTPEKDGFDSGELFSYRLELPDGTIIGNENITVEYATDGIISHTDTYATNGISRLLSFSATMPASFDCPDLQANIGDLCDDGDPCTENDTIQSDCTCAGTPIPCPDSIVVKDWAIETVCNQYSIQFAMEGGNGSYIVNEEVITGSQFKSPLMPCGTNYSFFITDQEHTDTVVISGAGPDCPSLLEILDLSFKFNDSKYTVEFTVQGGTGIYAVDGIALEADQFTSDPIDCSQTYSLKVTDGCDSLIVAGESPCPPCPSTVGNFSRLDTLCSGDYPDLPTNEEILATIGFPDNAQINWSGPFDQPMAYTGDGMNSQIFEFTLSISCEGDPMVQLTGGTIQFEILPTTKPVILGYDEVALCEGDTIELHTSSQFQEYEWVTGNLEDTLQVTQSDSIWVKVVDSRGCISLPSDTISLIFYDIPNQPTIVRISQDSLWCDLEAAQYVWERDGELLSDTTRAIKAFQSGLYAVQIFDEHCPSPFSEGVEIIVAIENVDIAHHFQIYPNPTSDFLIIEGNLPAIQEVYLIIYATSGQRIFGKRIQYPTLTFRETIDLQTFPPGIYFVQINVANGVICGNVVLR